MDGKSWEGRKKPQVTNEAFLESFVDLLQPLLGSLLADGRVLKCSAQAKQATADGLDSWAWNETRPCFCLGFYRLLGGSKPGFLPPFSALVKVSTLWKPGITLVLMLKVPWSLAVVRLMVFASFALGRLGLLGWFRKVYFAYHAEFRLRFRLAAGLGAFPQGWFPGWYFKCFYKPWCLHLELQGGIIP